jgi:electron transfer flavoprotein alpha subunit
MTKNIWVFAERINNNISPVTLELLGEASKIAKSIGDHTKISAILLGDNLSDCTHELIYFGADKVFLAEDPRLSYYNNETYSKIITTLAKEHKPDIFLIGSTATGSELAPTIAAKLQTGLAAHCVELIINEKGELVQVVPSFGGKVMGEIVCPDHRPQMATIKPGVFEKNERNQNRQGEIIKVDTDSILNNFKPRIVPTSVKTVPPQGKPLETAEIVVAGGWGIGSKEDWKMLEEFAKLLGAAVGCTRPAVDEGWAPGEHIMIGTSGKTIKPKVYIGIGISGAIHHICGIKDSGTIISINIDPQAAIFEVSDIKIVCDFKKILPLLIARIKSRMLDFV